MIAEIGQRYSLTDFRDHDMSGVRPGYFHAVPFQCRIRPAAR